MKPIYKAPEHFEPKRNEAIITDVPFDRSAKVTMGSRNLVFAEKRGSIMVFDDGTDHHVVLSARNIRQTGERTYEVHGEYAIKYGERPSGMESQTVSMKYDGSVLIEYPEDVVVIRKNPFADTEATADLPPDNRRNEPYATPLVQERTTDTKKGFRQVIRSLLGV